MDKTEIVNLLIDSGGIRKLEVINDIEASRKYLHNKFKLWELKELLEYYSFGETKDKRVILMGEIIKKVQEESRSNPDTEHTALVNMIEHYRSFGYKIIDDRKLIQVV